MQQNIISLKTNNVPQTERKLALKKRPLFKIKQLLFFLPFSFTYSFFFCCCYFLYSFGKSMSGRTLKAAQTVSTSQYKCTDSAKLHQLKSVHKQSVKLLIFFSFFFRFYTVSFIYNKITHLLLYFIFKKKNHMEHPDGSRRKK